VRHTVTVRAVCVVLAIVLGSAGGLGAQTSGVSEQIAEARRLFDDGRSARAAVLFDAAARRAEQEQLVDAQAFALLGLARATADRDRRSDAKPLFERALELFTRSGNRLGRAQALAASGANLFALGDRDEGRRRVIEANHTLRALNETTARETASLASLDVVAALDARAETAAWLMAVMDPGPAKDRARDEAMTVARASRLPEQACAIQQAWATELHAAGDLGRAYRIATEALRCYESTPRQARMWRALLSVADLERAHGQFETALAGYQRALEAARRTDNPVAIMACLNGVGVGQRALRHMDEARAAYQDALALARELHAENFTPYLLGQLGSHLVDEERFDEAIPLLKESLEQTRDPRVQIDRLISLGHSYARLGKRADAREATDRAVTLARVAGPTYLMNAYRFRAEARRLAGDLTGATTDLRDGINVIDELRDKTAPVDFMKRGFSEWHQWLFGSSIALLTHQGRVREALETAERARARAFLDLLATRDAEAARVTPTAATSAAASTPASAAAPSRLDSTQAVAAATVPGMIAAAKRLRSTLLVYWVDLDTTYIWVVAPTGRVTVKSVHVPQDRLAALAASTRIPASRIDDGLGLITLGRPAAHHAWRELHDLLIEPIRAQLPRTPNALLTIVPHGPLFQLSFAALQDERGQYLLERYRLHYTPAIGVLDYTARARQARARQQAQQRHAAGGGLLVGDPGDLRRTFASDAKTVATGDGNPAPPVAPVAAATVPPPPVAFAPGNPRADSLAPLPYARREVEEVAALVAAASAPPLVLIDSRASESEVRANLRGRSLLHFATHAVVRQDSDGPLASFLALRGDDSPNAAAANDGHLTADEVYSLQLDASLVVLSACSSALGPMTGDGVIGFTRAFLYAGATSVIATEWDVPDAAGYELMRRFYQSRRTTPDPSRALRAAQISTLTALRRGTITVSTPGGAPVALPEHPLFWAGFIIVGEP
jgi:CHAT domain-containing protein/tetratricopeptide (TPR) repeat protein